MRLLLTCQVQDLGVTLATFRFTSFAQGGLLALKQYIWSPMNDSSTVQGDSLPLSPLATSVLGIKGPLRLRPHGSTQKPHIILRRVTVSEDSDEDGGAGNIVRFSLFAAKRIEVKPGKEILLSVASPDGYFKDQPVVFEAGLMDSDEIFDGESDTQVAEEEIYLPLAGEAIPPKMRRAWTKKVEEVNLATRKCPSCFIVSPVTTLSFPINFRRPSRGSSVYGCTGRTRVCFDFDAGPAPLYTSICTNLYKPRVDTHPG